MKYKALVTGKNNSIIDDFFVHMDANFEVMSTSTRFGDIIRHIKYFDPDVFIYCLSGETPDNLRQMNNIKHNLAPTRIPFVLVGSKEECDEFEKFAVNVANMILVKPYTANSIQEKILKFLDERQEYVQAYRNRTDDQSDLNDKKNHSKIDKKSTMESADIDTLKNALSSLEAALSSSVKTSESDQNIDSRETAESETAERKHILVVDDDPVMLKMLKEQLHDKYDVATAINGKIALKFLERKKTDLILLDYEMPEESGPVVMEKIRAKDFGKNVPIVFLTGVSEREKITEALALKPQSYLLKPVDHEKLLKVITDVIG
ncbi:MAG: response regulator [Lachnospiraceae bacterium]|nr:response regulator [Lachnospiraceae bacterium]